MNQVRDNPFPFSDTNKRYHTLSYAWKQQYGKKAAKIPLDAGFTCPNRDGRKSYGGCAFCSSAGSGGTILKSGASLQEQYAANLERARRKWPDALGIPYFQAYSNTYASLDVLQRIYTPFLNDPQIPAIAIATRTDCLNEETAAWLSSWNKEVWIELGVQTIHDSTAESMNLKHTLEDAQSAISLCRRYHLKICLHIINGLPGESRRMMMETATWIARQQPDALKIHMLHLLDDSRLGRRWLDQPFDLMSLDDYVSLVCDQLEILPPSVIIERISGDGVADHLLAPDWTRRKTVVANRIDQELSARGSWQGKYWSWSDPDPVRIGRLDIGGRCAMFFGSLPYEAMRLRADVFLKEQGFAMEFDEEDAEAVHLVVYDKRIPAGCARLRRLDDQTWQIGRVAADAGVRRQKIGSSIVQAAVSFIRAQNGRHIILHAQCSAIPFYQKAGFEPYGPADYDEHVLHQWMRLDLQTHLPALASS